MINEANTLDLDDLDDEIQDSTEDYSFTSDVSEVDDNTETTETSEYDENFDPTDALLSLQGIYDKERIKFEDESGAVIEKSWNSLSNNEKLMILSHQEDPGTSLDRQEIELINQIRESGMTPGQFVQSLQTPPEPEVTYEVDGMSDDELFCLDLLDKVGSDNITDEELQQALDNAKANPNLFSKQVASLRVYYKDLEDQRQKQIQLENLEQEELKYEAFSNDVLSSIQQLNFLEDSPVELSYDEMEDLANFILTRDASGYSEFGQLLNNPLEFTKAAFWTLKGPEILYEMQQQIKEAYLRGYNESRRSNNTSKVYTKSQTPSVSRSNNKESQYAYFDEDSYLND